MLRSWIQHINHWTFSPTQLASQYFDLNSSNRPFIGRGLKLVAASTSSNCFEPNWCFVSIDFFFHICILFLYFVEITTLQWIWILFRSLCVFSFKTFFSVLFLCVQRFFSLHSYIHPFSSSYLFIIQRKWKFFFCDMVGCCQGSISRSAFLSQSRKGMVKSVDLFGFYPFSCQLFFGFLVCVCGKQYEMGTEKNFVTDAGYAWRTQKVMRNERLRQCVIGCSNTMCFLTPCSLSTLLTFSHFSRVICFPDIVLTWPDPTMTFIFLLMVAAFLLLSSSFYL